MKNIWQEIRDPLSKEDTHQNPRESGRTLTTLLQKILLMFVLIITISIGPHKPKDVTFLD